MSLNLIRNLSRLSLRRSIVSSSIINRFSSNADAILRNNLTLSGFYTRELSTKTGSNVDPPPIDLTKFATYEQIKDLPNHPEKLLIDVREQKELVETGIIPTSINIPLKNVTENLKLSSHDFVEKYKRLKPDCYTEIIFTCRSGKRADDACTMAQQLGFKNVKNYKGSWMEWAEKENLKK